MSATTPALVEELPTAETPIITALLSGLGGIITLCGVLGGAAMVTDLHRAVPIVLFVVSAVAGATQAALKEYVQRRTVPAADVLEARVNDVVVAGPANERVATGDVVRELDGPEEPEMVVPRRAADDPAPVGVVPLAEIKRPNRVTMKGSWPMLLLGLPAILIAEFHPIITHKPEGTLTNIVKTLLGAQFSVSWFVGVGLVAALAVWVVPHMAVPGWTGRWLTVLLIGFAVGGFTCWAVARTIIP